MEVEMCLLFIIDDATSELVCQVRSGLTPSAAVCPAPSSLILCLYNGMTSCDMSVISRCMMRMPWTQKFANL